MLWVGDSLAVVRGVEMVVDFLTGCGMVVNGSSG